MNPHPEAVLASIDQRRAEIVAFLQKLISYQSVTGQEGEIQAFAAGYMKELGLDVDVFEPDVDRLRSYPGFLEPELPFAGRPNVVGVWKGSGGGRSLLLNGHVDTVPLEPLSEWETGPLAGEIVEGKIVGRGASDMKSGVAAMTMAVQILKQMGVQLKGDVILEYVVDEERTGLGTLACVERGYTADAGICCETSDLEVMPACIGRMWFTVKLKGKPTGIATRWEGVSSIEKAYKIIQAVEDLEKIRIQDLHHPLYPDNRGALPCAVTMIHAGTFPSTAPEDAVLRGSLGLMPYEDPEDAKQQLIDQIDLVCKADPWLRDHPPFITTEGGYVAAGAEIPRDHPIVQTMQANFQSVTGRLPVISGRMGAADTRFLTRSGHTPTVIFGPGVTAQMHAMNENVPIDHLITATKVIALTILNWCNSDKD
ncbi:MAG: acetylornithine deacetylase [Anaerolineae bacterium UTCFX2]|mgnify:CR=1 FL=1|jgi:acetylornithine deacetylase|nr:ArgE/DapE family deacylase [Anaerolineales bacterium]OQY90498.1 MAG: acetylornithine deacetylase [Anaerolineae bacterium UTCFX2]